MLKIEFIGPRIDSITGWSRRCQVGTDKFNVSVSRGKSVRIPYKPRGKNRGWKWNGCVYQDGKGYLWNGTVPGSIGCRGLLIEAGVINDIGDENG